MDTVGSRIKALRSPHNQEWLAASLGIPKATLSNYESGKSELNFAILKAITAIFNVTSDWLLFGIGPQFRSPAAGAPAQPEAACHACALLERALSEEREERRELNRECKHLLEEKSALKEHIGRLEERLRTSGSPL